MHSPVASMLLSTLEGCFRLYDLNKYYCNDCNYVGRITALVDAFLILTIPQLRLCGLITIITTSITIFHSKIFFVIVDTFRGI